MTRLERRLKKKDFVVIVSPPKNSVELVEAAFEGGADAVKVHINVHHKASGNHFGSWGDELATIRRIVKAATGPVGLMPGSHTVATPADMEQAAEEGIDFFDIYDFDCPTWMLNLPLTKMLAVGPDYTLDGVRALDQLGLDILEASIVPTTAYGTPLTVQDLERYHLLVRATEKPVIVPSQKRIEPQDLPLLRSAGIRGVMLGTISLGQTAESFRERLPRYTEAA